MGKPLDNDVFPGCTPEKASDVVDSIVFSERRREASPVSASTSQPGRGVFMLEKYNIHMSIHPALRL